MPTDAKMKEAIENLKKVDNKVDYNSCCSRRNYVYLSSESSGGDSIKNFLEWVREDVVYRHWYMPTIDMVATGRNIMRLREVAGLTVRDLQDIFGFATPQAIYKWQHGTAMPTIDNLVVLAAVLDVPMDEIIVIDVNRTKQISA